jgi:hypothetical protein
VQFNPSMALKVHNMQLKGVGHDSITLTLDTCFHVIPSLPEEAARSIDDLISYYALSLSYTIKHIVNNRQNGLERVRVYLMNPRLATTRKSGDWTGFVQMDLLCVCLPNTQTGQAVTQATKYLRYFKASTASLTV